MKIPKIYKRDGKTYNLIKVYKCHALYELEGTTIKECFTFHELGLIKETEKIKEASKGGNISF